MRRVVVLLGLVSTVPAAVFASSGGADAGGYVWRDSREPGVSPTPPSFTGPRTPIALSDDSVAVVPLAQPMPFYGIPAATAVHVSDNGWLAFSDPAGLAAPVSASLPSVSLPNALLAYFWDDLDPAAGVAEIGPISGGQAIHIRARQRSSGSTVEVWIELYPSGRIKVDYVTAATVAPAGFGAEDETGTRGTELAQGGRHAAGFTPGAPYAFELLPPSALGCPGSAPLTCGSSVSLSTLAGVAGVSKYSCSTASYAGQEVIVPVDLTVETSLTVTLSDFAPRSMSVFLLGTCHESSCIAGGGASLTVPLLFPGRYYLVVDGPGAASDGPFTLTVECTPPGAPAHTGWLQQRGSGTIRVATPFPLSADPAEYDLADFPPPEDPKWTPTPDRNLVDFNRASLLCGDTCRAALDFSYFRTCLYLPATSTSLVFTATGLDDGVAVRLNATQAVTADNGTFTSPNLSGNAALVPGAINEISAIHVDDCCSISSMRNFQFKIDGAAVPATLAKSCQAVPAIAPIGRTLCAGESVTLDGSASRAPLCAEPVQFRWRRGSTPLGPYSADPTVEVTPDATATYSLDVLCPGGCGCEATADVTVEVSPPMTVAVPGSIAMCVDGPAALGGIPTVSGGTAPIQFLWSPADDLSDETSANPTAMPALSTTYDLTITDAAGCTALASERVDVSTLAHGVPPTVSICGGTGALLGGSPTATGGTPPYSYSWQPAALVDDPTSANPIATPQAREEFFVTIVDAEGCGVMASEVVEVAGGLPSSLGNSLRGVRDQADAVFSWAGDVNAVDYSLKSDTSGPFTAPVVAATTPQPLARLAGVVPLAPALVFYRANGVGCAGEGE